MRCKEREQKRAVHADFSQHIISQRASFDNLKTKTQQRTYLFMRHWAGIKYHRKYYNKLSWLCGINENSCWMYPLTGAKGENKNIILCRQCFMSTHDITYPTMIELERVSPNLGIALPLCLAYDHILLQLNDATTTLVISIEMLERYDTIIHLQNPSFVKNKNDGKFRYDNKVIVETNKKRVVVDANKTTINIMGNTAVVVPKRKMDECVSLAEGSVKLQYNYADTAKPWNPNNYILLCSTTCVEANESDFHPVEGDLDIVKAHKNSIVKEDGHFGSSGFYAGHGVHSSYKSYDDGIGVHLERYATKDTSPEQRSQFDNMLEMMTSLLWNAKTKLALVAGYDIVQASCSHTDRSRIAADLINPSLTALGYDETHQVDLQPLEYRGNSLYFPSLNINVDASTSQFHTETDQGYTLIVVPYQTCSKRATFMFELGHECHLNLRLTDGFTFLFNARLLTHRQQMDADNGRNETCWNLGCYANRRLDHLTFCKLETEFAHIVNNVHTLL